MRFIFPLASALFPFFCEGGGTRFNYANSIQILDESQLVSLLAMAKSMHNDVPSKNVIAQTVVTPANPPLAIARFHSNKLLDLVLTAEIVGIFPEDGGQFF
jgi:hypothetical protein